jgi:hypothetical protein
MPTDRKGNAVFLGTKVRLLKLGEWVYRELPADEVAELETMVGDVFEVSQVDEYGVAWIGKDWYTPEGKLDFSHTLALDSDEMEVV